jgi:hypothetical protein
MNARKEDEACLMAGIAMLKAVRIAAYASRAAAALE